MNIRKRLQQRLLRMHQFYQRGERQWEVRSTRQIKAANRTVPKFRVGDYYEDCAYRVLQLVSKDHQTEGSDLLGRCLWDSNTYRCCRFNCGPVRLTEAEAMKRKRIYLEEGKDAYYTYLDVLDHVRAVDRWNQGLTDGITPEKST
jgi:hypothetical protein